MWGQKNNESGEGYLQKLFENKALFCHKNRSTKPFIK